MKLSSFIDVHGATISVSANELLAYTGVKAEQLSALAQLMTNIEVGAIELGERDRQIFQLMTTEYAKSVESLVRIRTLKKGGA